MIEAEIRSLTTESGDVEHELVLWYEDGRTCTARLAPGLLTSKNWRV